jgi:putative transcriptional regulator
MGILKMKTKHIFWTYMMKRCRLNENISQQELAFKIGVSRNTINSIENGRIQPTIDHAKKISELFDVPLDFLLIESDEIDTKLKGRTVWIKKEISIN